MTRPSRPDAKVRGATAAALPCNSPLQQIRLFRRPSRGEGPVSAGPAAMDGRKVDPAHTTPRSSCKNFEHSHALSFHRIVSGKTCFFAGSRRLRRRKTPRVCVSNFQIRHRARETVQTGRHTGCRRCGKPFHRQSKGLAVKEHALAAFAPRKDAAPRHRRAKPETSKRLGFGRGLGFARAQLQALGAALTATIQFFFPFDFLMCHDSSSR